LGQYGRRGREGGDVPWISGLRSTGERGVDVLEEHDTSLGSVGEKVVELVVRQSALG
jgi:hypothetical protein